MFYYATNRTSYQVNTAIPESEWVKRAKNGDEDAFVHLAKQYHSKIWSTASRYARSRHELEDLTQDLLLKIWKGLPTYQAKAPFEHWVMTIAVRGCYDFLRKNRKRRESERLIDPTDHVQAVDSSPGRIQSQAEASEVVALLLQQLDAKDRTVITLLDLEEKSIREAAELTGWSESNVKVRAHRARKKLKLIYEELKTEL